MNELARCDLLLEEVAEILDKGFDCSRSRRKKDTLEKCIAKGRKTLNIPSAG